MASVYSDKHWTGDYTYTRVRVDYSGTSASAHLLYTRTNDYSGATSISGATFSFGGSSTDFSATRYGRYTDSEVASVSFSISMAGGTYSGSTGGYSGGGYFAFSGSVSIPAQYTAPSSISGTNVADGTVRGRAKVSVSVGNWGQSSSAGTYRAYKSGSGDSQWGNSSSSSFTFTGVSGSTTTSCAITTWYPGATNNHNLSGRGSAKYIASPAGQTVSVAGSSNRAATFTSSVAYKGGESNSATANTGTMARYQLWLTKDTGGTPSWPTSPQQDKASSATSLTFDAISHSTFETDSNYAVRINPINTFGAYAETIGTLYKPSNVSATIDATQPKQAVFNLKTNKPGGWLSDATGTIAGYRIEYGKTTSYGTTAAYSTATTRTISNLDVDTTYYYRITAWNTLGLSAYGTGSFKTAAYYGPTISATTWTSTGNGLSVSSTITKSGGATEDSATISSTKLQIKPASSSTWQTVKTDTSGSRSINFTYTGGFSQAGDYNVRLLVTNSVGMESDSTTTLSAPSVPTVSNVKRFYTYPNAFQCDAQTSSSGSAAITGWRLDTTAPSVNQGTMYETTSLSVSNLRSAFGLQFDTAYTAVAKVWNRYGLWNQSREISFTTSKRVQWYIVNQNYPADVAKKVTPSMRLANTPTTTRQITASYFVVANALSYASVSSDFSGYHLRFIEEPLFYFEDAIASIKFTNGNTIAYALDSTDGLYKYGIWRGNSLQTTFFDGLEWKMSHYVLEGNWVVQSIVKNPRGLSFSPVFATTVCEPHHYGED